MKARDLLTADVVVHLGERLTVAPTPRGERNTALVATGQAAKQDVVLAGRNPGP